MADIVVIRVANFLQHPFVDPTSQPGEGPTRQGPVLPSQWSNDDWLAAYSRADSRKTAEGISLPTSISQGVRTGGLLRDGKEVGRLSGLIHLDA